ncbi:MAG: hypothetical protein AAGI72_09960 [Pseudomonadota bacterium]
MPSVLSNCFKAALKIRSTWTSSGLGNPGGLPRLLIAGGALLVLCGCAMRSDYNIYYFAEQGDYDAALASAREAQGGGIDGFIFGDGASECRDYAAVVTVLVAKGDFAGARAACANYDQQCAVLPDGALCFIYENAELAAATSDTQLAETLSSDAREQLHFRWLMIRDDYENRGLKRPIY